MLYSLCLQQFLFLYHINRKQLLIRIRNKSYDTKVILYCKRNLQIKFFFFTCVIGTWSNTTSFNGLFFLDRVIDSIEFTVVPMIMLSPWATNSLTPPSDFGIWDSNIQRLLMSNPQYFYWRGTQSRYIYIDFSQILNKVTVEIALQQLIFATKFFILTTKQRMSGSQQNICEASFLQTSYAKQCWPTMCTPFYNMTALIAFSL